jgi:hypothetical protein
LIIGRAGGHPSVSPKRTPLIFRVAGGAPFHATQTNAVEFPGACLPQAGRIPSVFEGVRVSTLRHRPITNYNPQNHFGQLNQNCTSSALHLSVFVLPILPYSCFFVSRMLPWSGRKNMRRFPKSRDPRFALTTLRNLNIEVRTYAPLVQAAQEEREWQARAAQYAAPQPLATPAAPDSIPSAAFPENVASTAPDPDPTALAPLDSANSDSVRPDSTNPDSPSPGSSNEAAQQILDPLVADVIAAGSSLPSSSSDDKELTAPPTPKPRRKPKSKSSRKSKRGTGLPAAQAALPAHTNVLSTAACLPDRQASEEILIASPPNIKKRCNPLKTILSYSS